MKNLIIFDDCVEEGNQELQRSFYTTGRHNGCHCIYLSQTFFDIDSVIRKNSNCFILFMLNQRDLSNVTQSVIHRRDNKVFKNICNDIWNEKYKYICINTLEPKDNIFINITGGNW